MKKFKDITIIFAIGTVALIILNYTTDVFAC